jgi:hypothetical protein
VGADVTAARANGSASVRRAIASKHSAFVSSARPLIVCEAIEHGQRFNVPSRRSVEFDELEARLAISTRRRTLQIGLGLLYFATREVVLRQCVIEQEVPRMLICKLSQQVCRVVRPSHSPQKIHQSEPAPNRIGVQLQRTSQYLFCLRIVVGRSDKGTDLAQRALEGPDATRPCTERVKRRDRIIQLCRSVAQHDERLDVVRLFT